MYSKDKELNDKLSIIEKTLQEKNPWKIIEESKYIIDLAKDTLNYYRHYQTDRFLFCLMLMWISWIVLLFVDLSGVPRQSIELGYYSWMVVPNIALAVTIIPLLIEYAGNSFVKYIGECTIYYL